jgi:HD superfamily phosphohydrolase
MHLSSQFLSACLKNSDTEVKTELLEAIHELVRDQLDELHRSEFDTELSIEDIKLSETALVAHAWCNDIIQGKSVSIVEQSLRLASLFHDLGHLPFSHDFEYALSRIYNATHSTLRSRDAVIQLYDHFGSSEVKIHERIGPELGHILLRELNNTNPGEPHSHRNTRTLIFDLAYQIWNAKDPQKIASDASWEPPLTRRERILGWLKSIISGELDVDRCDYLLRDGRNYGFEFAPFNLERLLSNLVAAKLNLQPPTDSGGQADYCFMLAVRSQGFSALESFVLSRHRSYQLGILHHKVSQVSIALEQAIVQCIEGAYTARPDQGNVPTVKQFLDDLQALATYSKKRRAKERRLEYPHGILDRFAFYDDGWWMERMRSHFGAESTTAWANLVLWRSPGPVSLWKRVDNFEEALKEAATQDSRIPAALKEWNGLLPPERERAKAKAWRTVEEELERERGVLILRKEIRPYKTDDSRHSKGFLVLVQGSDSPVPLTQLSPLTRSLGEAWDESIQVQAFAERPLDDQARTKLAAEVVVTLWPAMDPNGSDAGERKESSE